MVTVMIVMMTIIMMMMVVVKLMMMMMIIMLMVIMIMLMMVVMLMVVVVMLMMTPPPQCTLSNLSPVSGLIWSSSLTIPSPCMVVQALIGDPPPILLYCSRIFGVRRLAINGPSFLQSKKQTLQHELYLWLGCNVIKLNKRCFTSAQEAASDLCPGKGVTGSRGRPPASQDRPCSA